MDVPFQPAANQPWVAAGAPRMISAGRSMKSAPCSASIHPSGGQAGLGRSRGAVVTEAIKNEAMDERGRVRATVEGNVAVGAPARAAVVRIRPWDHVRREDSGHPGRTVATTALPTPLPARRARSPPARGSRCGTPLPRQAPRPRRQSTTCPDGDDHRG